MLKPRGDFLSIFGVRPLGDSLVVSGAVDVANIERADFG